MDTPPPEGWVDTEYKTFRAREESSSDSEDSDSDEEDEKIRGYKKKSGFKKIIQEEELIPE